MKVSRIIIAEVVLGMCCTLSLPTQNIFVDLGEVADASPSTTTINSPLAAATSTWQFSAAAQVASSTWNIAPRVATSTLASGGISNPNISNPAGDYSLYASAMTLVDSLGMTTP